MNIDRSTGLLKCGLCSRKFSSQQELKDHLPTHFGSRSSARPPELLNGGIKHKYISHPGRLIKTKPKSSNGEVKGKSASLCKPQTYQPGRPIKLEPASFNDGTKSKFTTPCKPQTYQSGRPIKLEKECCAVSEVETKCKSASPSKVQTVQPFLSVFSESEPPFVDDAGDEDYDPDELEIKKAKKNEKVPGTHVCTICNRDFPYASFLKKHERNMHIMCNYKCRYCTETFNDCDTRRKHERRAHKDIRLYKCNYCQKTFNYPLSLKNHIRIHTGEKPFECDVCKRKFTERGTMVAHRRVHFDETPYHCNLCDREFKFSSSLKAHKKAHEKVRPFQCNLCMNFYSSKKTLRSHRMKIHPEQFAEDEKQKEAIMQLKKDGPPFFCPVCNNPFASKKTLRAHTMRIHSFSYNQYLIDKSKGDGDLTPIINLGKQFGVDFSKSFCVGAQLKQSGGCNSEPQQAVELNHTEMSDCDTTITSFQTLEPSLPTETTDEEIPSTEIMNSPIRRSLLSTDPKRRFKASKSNAAVLTSSNTQAKRTFLSNRSIEKIEHQQMLKIEKKDTNTLNEESKMSAKVKRAYVRCNKPSASSKQITLNDDLNLDSCNESQPVEENSFFGELMDVKADVIS